MTLTKAASRRIGKKYDALLEKEKARYEKNIERIYARKGRELTKAIRRKR